MDVTSMAMPRRKRELEQCEKRLAWRRGARRVAEIDLGRDQRFRWQPEGPDGKHREAERGCDRDEPDRAPWPFAGLRLGH
jgi:hypothetical protein